jgi:hypothetical protein
MANAIDCYASVTACLAYRADPAALLSGGRLLNPKHFQHPRGRPHGYQCRLIQSAIASGCFRYI